MSLTIYTSRQSSGTNPARSKVLEDCAAFYKKTKFNKRRKIFIITPKQDTYQVEREIIDLIGEGGLLGMQVTDFQSFIMKMITEENHNIQIVDEHGRLMLVQKSLLDVNNQLGIFRGSIKEPNFKNAILDELDELKQAQITPQIISDKIEELNDGLLKRKLKDLSLILEALNNNIGHNNYDQADLNSLSLDLISDSTFLDDIQLFCIDDNSISYPEILFLVLATKKVKNIEIALNTDTNPVVPDNSVFQLSNKILFCFEQLAKEYGIDLNIINLKLNKNNNSLDWLAHEFFSYYPKKYPKDNLSVKVYEARNPWDEVNQIAQQILLDHNSGIPFSKIAVASNSPADYEDLLKRVFSQYGIPYFVDENHKVIDNHFIQFLLAALDSVNNNFIRSDVLSYIKSDFSGLTSDQTDLIENYIIEAGIRPNEWKKPFKRIPRAWKKEVKELTSSDEIIKIQNKILKDLKPFFSSIKTTQKVQDYIKQVQNFLIQTKCQEKLDEISEEISNEGHPELSSRYRQIWNIFQEILEQMESALGDVEISFNDFISILKSGIASYEVGVIPEDNDAVIISSLERTILPETDNLYFLGLNEDMVPKKKTDESLLTDYDKEQLINLFEIPNNIIQDREFRVELEENNFYELLTKPKKKIFFTYHTYTSGGDQDFPSRFLDVLKQIYGKEVFVKPTKFFSLLSPSRANVILENFINKTDYIKLKKILTEWFSNNRADNALKAIQTLSIKPDDFLDDIDVKDLYQFRDGKNKVSISRLENFASCPFKHFINYGLRLTDREEYEIRTFDTGIIIHEIFNQFLSSILNKTKKDPITFNKEIKDLLENSDSFNSLLDEIFERVFSELEEFQRYNHTAASRHLISKVKRVCKLALRLILEQLKDSGFIPSKLEKYFSRVRDDGIIVEGRIDRIDSKQDSQGNKTIRVIDYKTWDKNIEYIDLLYGKSLQLATYLLEALKSDHSHPIGKGAYYFIAKPSGGYKDGEDIPKKIREKFKLNGINLNDNSEDKDISGLRSKKSPSSLTDEELDLLLDHSSNLIGELTDALSNGDISINPVFKNGEADSCKYCGYRDVCRFNPNDKEYNFKKLYSIEKDQFFDQIINKEKTDE